jgi:triosephosphate isomerase
MKIIIANWKMNQDFDKTDEWLSIFLEKYSKIYDSISKRLIILCPPATIIDYIDSELMEDGFSFLEKIAKQQNKKVEDFSVEEFNEIIFSSRIIKLGGQDCGVENNGAYTGQISAKMLKDVGCEYVIIGHSERRKYQQEDDQMISKKITTALNHKIFPILCVGENEQVRANNDQENFVAKQILGAIDKSIEIKKLIIAYEPIWAIGTGKIATTQEISQMANFIKEFVGKNFSNIAEFYLLYGGSVSSSNSAEILQITNIDGLLVGGASLDANEFIAIANS